MKTIANSKTPWVISRLGTGLFGLNCTVVREMVIMPEVCEVPDVPAYVRGVLNLRGRVTPVVDLRLRLGMRSAKEEIDSLCDLMEQRAQDHQRWLRELEASVRENRKFTLARDPHQCAFGKWYDTFETDNILISGFLKRFDAPHKRVHALAAELEELVQKGHAEEALERIERARTGVLATTLKLFTDFQQVIRDNRREIAVVLNGRAGDFAVAVDSVAAVEKLPEAEIEELAGKGLDIRERLVTSVAKRTKSRELVLVLDMDAILGPTTNSGMLRE